MQLDNTKPASIKNALAVASCSLLGSTAAVADTENSWEFETALLVYSEADRVSAAEAIINGNKEFDDQHFLNLRLTVDTLTGASANGAVAQAGVQTFTRPSGNGQYQIKGGETPLDDTFHDTRVQLNAQWTQPVRDNLTASGGMHLSKEFDYLSLGLNGSLAYDFNLKNSTFSVGFSHFKDTFSPEGGIPRPFSSMLIGDSSAPSWDQEFALTRLIDEDDKTTTDILLGFTQVINRRMISQFNYSYSMVDGYLTDPFKVLSVVDGNGQTQDLVYEHRPDKRTKQSVFAQTKYHFGSGVLDLSYRYLWDDWEITSHTLDSRYRIELGNGRYIEPHLRYYQQQAAEFFRPFLHQGDAIPSDASSDYRIGEMAAYTLGVKYGMVLSNGNDLAIRVEYYSQHPTNAGFDESGELANLDLYEPVNALLVQVNYSF